MKFVSIAAMVGGLGIVAVGCAADPSETAASEGESDLRAVSADELLGQIRYGETKEVVITTTPRYRAYSFVGEKYDYIQAQVISQDATDPVLWLADADFNTVAMNNDVSPTDSSSALNGRVLPKSGTYYLIFRELNAAPSAEFAVSLRKLGAIPPQCDPDGEGLFAPDCTSPPDFDPFKANSCVGDPLSTAEAATKFAGEAGLRLGNAKVYYQTRQCRDVGGSPECSAWVRAWPMDIRLGSVASSPATANQWSFRPADPARKTSIAFSLEPARTTSFCVDGPFYDLRGDAWAPLPAGGIGACGTAATSIVTKTCARIEAAPIQVAAGRDRNYYTEFSAVLLASY